MTSSEIVTQKKIILASGSAIRKQMLVNAGLFFSIQQSELNESEIKKKFNDKPFKERVIKLASAKAAVISAKNPESYVIGADQMCVCGEDILDKAGNFENAVKILSMLSGNTHQQYSGVCVFYNGESLWSYADQASLTMHKLSQEEIISYIKTDEPFQCSGCYKFESHGVNLFLKIEGSHHTIQGLALLPLLNTLRDIGLYSLKN